MEKTLFRKSEFLQKALDAIPSILLIADPDLSVHYLNLMALQKLGSSNKDVYKRKGGEVLKCLNALPKGCGKSENCKNCIIIKLVDKSIQEWEVFREKTRMQIINKDNIIDIHFLLTSAPLKYEDKIYVLLALEDISELIQLRSLLPICANCKKVKNDKNYWESIERYLKNHIDVDFSHSICEECAEKLYPGMLKKKL